MRGNEMINSQTGEFQGLVPIGVVKLRYNALKLFFDNVLFNANVPLSARFRFISIFCCYVARNNHPF